MLSIFGISSIFTVNTKNIPTRRRRTRKEEEKMLKEKLQKMSEKNGKKNKLCYKFEGRGSGILKIEFCLLRFFC